MLPNRRQSIPADLAVEEVEFAYTVDALRSQKHLWVRCCECRRDHNHRRGFVLRFEDQTRATLGRDCGRVKHSLDHDVRIKDFEGRMVRARLLKQALAMLEEGPVIATHLRCLRADPTVSACLNLKVALSHKLPEFARRLEAVSDGRISAKVSVRDFEAEKQRDARLDHKLDVEARRQGRSRDEPDVDRELLAASVASGDRDASKTPIVKLESRVFHTFSGHEFFSVLPRVAIRAQMLESQLLESFSTFRGKTSISVSNRAIEIARKKFLAALDVAITLTHQVEAATRFVLPSNMTGIVRALNRFSKPDDQRQVMFCDGILFRTHAPDEPLVDTRLPPLALTSSGLVRTRERIMNAYVSVLKAA